MIYDLWLNFTWDMTCPKHGAAWPPAIPGTVHRRLEAQGWWYRWVTHPLARIWWIREDVGAFGSSLWGCGSHHAEIRSWHRPPDPDSSPGPSDRRWITRFGRGLQQRLWWRMKRLSGYLAVTTVTVGTWIHYSWSTQMLRTMGAVFWIYGYMMMV